MEFVSLGAMVVTLRGVVVGGFPIQIAKMKTQVIQAGSRVSGDDSDSVKGYDPPRPANHGRRMGAAELS